MRAPSLESKFCVSQRSKSSPPCQLFFLVQQVTSSPKYICTLLAPLASACMLPGGRVTRAGYAGGQRSAILPSRPLARHHELGSRRRACDGTLLLVRVGAVRAGCTAPRIGTAMQRCHLPAAHAPTTGRTAMSGALTAGKRCPGRGRAGCWHRALALKGRLARSDDMQRPAPSGCVRAHDRLPKWLTCASESRSRAALQASASEALARSGRALRRLCTQAPGRQEAAPAATAASPPQRRTLCNTSRVLQASRQAPFRLTGPLAEICP